MPSSITDHHHHHHHHHQRPPCQAEAAETVSPGELGDFSQKGNLTGFRNESLDGEPIIITSDWLVRGLPERGILRFDFSSISRPHIDVPSVSERRFRQLCHAIGMKSFDLTHTMEMPNPVKNDDER